MAYVVKAAMLSAETAVNDAGGRAVVDFHRGAALPPDVPDEQVQHLLRLGHIEPDEALEVDPVEPEDPEDPEEPEEQVDLSAMDKDALLAYADEHGLTVDKRLGVDNLRAAIEAAE